MNESRKKILILEDDDFLREILGNLLHKQGCFILNGRTLEEGLRDAHKQHIDVVIIGTSCSDIKSEGVLHYLKERIGGHINFFVIHQDNEIFEGLPQEQQISLSNLSVSKIINTIVLL